MGKTDHGKHQWIRQYLGQDTGRCLEIGARDGSRDSITLDLIRSGWHAVLVEPHAVHCESMRQLYNDIGATNRCTIVNAAILLDKGDTVDKVTMYDPWPDPTGPSPSSSVFRHWAEQSQQRMSLAGDICEVEVPAMRISRLLQEVGLDFDFVAIDAEGLSIPLALGMPWYQMPTRLLTVEACRSVVQDFHAMGWHLREIFEADLFLGR